MRHRLRLLVEGLDAPPRHRFHPSLAEACSALACAPVPPSVLVVAPCALPPAAGATVFEGLRRHAPVTVLLAVRGERSALLEALRIGADGFVCPDEPLERGLRTLRAALDGGLYLSPAEAARLRRELVPPPVYPPELSRLSPREQEVLALLARGVPQPGMAQRLGISAATVSTHVQRLYDKLSVHSAPAAVYEGVRRGLLPV